jgi:hypothetical protein
VSLRSAGFRRSTLSWLQDTGRVLRGIDATDLRTLHRASARVGVWDTRDAGALPAAVAERGDTDKEPLPDRRGCGLARHHGRDDGRSGRRGSPAWGLGFFRIMAASKTCAARGSAPMDPPLGFGAVVARRTRQGRARVPRYPIFLRHEGAHLPAASFVRTWRERPNSSARHCSSSISRLEQHVRDSRPPGCCPEVIKKGVGGVDGTRTRGLRRDRPAPTTAERSRTRNIGVGCSATCPFKVDCGRLFRNGLHVLANGSRTRVIGSNGGVLEAFATDQAARGDTVTIGSRTWGGERAIIMADIGGSSIVSPERSSRRSCRQAARSRL